MSNPYTKKRFAIPLTLAVLAVFATVVAQSALTVAQSDDYGTHLATVDGASVYLYVKDSAAESACLDACTNNWRPVLADDGALTTDSLDSSLLASVQRPDGVEQVTYNGHPLYTFARDTNEGTTRGQKLGNEFFLVSTDGNAITDKVAQQASDADPAVVAALVDAGASVFSNNCAVCHGTDGEGNIGPKLADNQVVGDKDFFVERVLDGFTVHGMPPFRDVLSDDQIAAVTTFVRNSWGNEFGPILSEEVSARR